MDIAHRLDSERAGGLKQINFCTHPSRGQDRLARPCPTYLTPKLPENLRRTPETRQQTRRAFFYAMFLGSTPLWVRGPAAWHWSTCEPGPLLRLFSGYCESFLVYHSPFSAIFRPMRGQLGPDSSSIPELSFSQKKRTSLRVRLQTRWHDKIHQINPGHTSEIPRKQSRQTRICQIISDSILTDRS